MKKFLNWFRRLLGNPYSYYYVLDFGRFSIKAAALKVHREKKEGTILKTTELRHKKNINYILKKKKARNAFAEDINKLLEDFRGIIPKKKAELIIGVSSELVGGYSYPYSYEREKPEAQIEIRDIKNVIHNAQLKSYEAIRQRFVGESGYPPKELCLLNKAVQKFQVDGRQTQDPIGEEGKELYVNIFNAYAPKFYKNFLHKVASYIKVPVADIIYTPYALFDSLQKQEGENLYALIVDIGLGTTRVGLVRKGVIQDINSFSFGGDAFTRRIMKYLGLGYGEAERLKVRYYDGDLSDNATKALNKIMHGEVNVFLNALNLILREFSNKTLLPSSIYLCGGGANSSLINGIIKKRVWKKNLSFTSPPKIRKIDFEDFSYIKVEDKDIYIQRYAPVLALANHYICQQENKKLVLNKTLQRMSKLITS